MILITVVIMTPVSIYKFQLTRDRLRSSVCLFVCLFVCSFVRLFVCSCVRVFVCSCVRVFVCSCVRVFVCSCVCSFVCYCRIFRAVFAPYGYLVCGYR